MTKILPNRQIKRFCALVFSVKSLRGVSSCQKKLYCTTCCYWLQHAAFQLACAFWRKNWLLFAVFACATFSPTPFFNLSLFSTLLLLMWNWTISLLNVVALIYFLLEKVTRIFSNKWNNLQQKLKNKISIGSAAAGFIHGTRVMYLCFNEIENTFRVKDNFCLIAFYWFWWQKLIQV